MFVVALLAVVGCGESFTTIQLAVGYDDSWSLSEMHVASLEQSSTVDPRHELTIQVPDEWAGEPITIEIWGLRASDRIAHGKVTVTPVMDVIVSTTVNLELVPCGVWCTAGATMCAGDAVVICEQRGDDHCFEWSDAIACEATSPYCSVGTCSTTCVDECADGETRCAGPSGTQSCGQADSDECLDWLDVTPCSAGQVCSNASCGPSCQDECTAGDVHCAGGGVISCGDRNVDGCLEWGPAQPCANGSCSNGVCDAVCSDECSSSSCAALTFHSCGQYDLDGCLDRSPGTSCVPVDGCELGTCDAGAGCSSAPKVCDQVPAAECIDDSTLRTYYGTCAAGACSYPFHDATCTGGCSAGACSCSQTSCTPENIATSGSQRHVLALDDVHVYWAANDFVMRRAKSLAGGEEIVAAGQGDAFGVAVDGTHVYWTDVTSGTIMRRLKSLAAPAEVVADGQSQPRWVVVDATHVYWASKQSVTRRPKSLATPAETIATEGPNSIEALAVDDTHVYWAANPGVRRRVKTTANPAVDVSADGPVYALALDGSHVYWATQFEILRRVKTLAIAEQRVTWSAPVRWLTLDDTQVYWSDDTGVAHMPKDLSVASAGILAADDPYTVAVDATHVYVSSTMIDASVRRVARCACEL
ncbi:MAG: hypothetical protein AB7P03_18095 [Kofleriaceae bacterium]